MLLNCSAEKTLESPLDNKEIKPVNPKGNQSWIFIGRTDAEAEGPILWPPDVKNWLIGKDPDARKDWRQEKGMAEAEMVGWHHWLNRHEFEQTLRVGEGQGSLVGFNLWGHKESDMVETLNNNNPNKISASNKSSSRWRLPDISVTSFYDSRENNRHLLSPQKTPQDQHVGLAQAPVKSLLFPWLLVCTRICMHPARVESLLPPVLWRSCSQAPLPFKVKYSGGSSSPYQTPSLGSLMWDSQLSLLWKNFSDIIILQFVIRPPKGYGICLYDECILPTILLSFFFMSLGVGSFFGRFKSFFISGCSAVSFDFGVLVGEGELKVLLLCQLVSSPNQEKCFLKQRERWLYGKIVYN